METALRPFAPHGWWMVFLAIALPSCGPERGRPSPDTVGSGPPARIVSLLPAATEILDALGAGDRLVAASADMRPRSGLPDAGDPLHPSLEVISRISPDLILASPQTELGPLRRAAPEGAAILSLEILTLDDLRDAIRDLGSLLELEARARSLLATLEDDLRRARQAGRSAGRPRVAWVVWHDPPILAGRGTFIDEVLSAAGGTNVVLAREGTWPTLSFEVLHAMAPDIIVWPDGAGVAPPEMAPEPWRALQAMQAGAVVTVPARAYQVPGPSIGEAAAELAHRLARARRTP